MSSVAIRAEHLAKQYSIGDHKQRHDTLRDLFADSARSIFQHFGRSRAKHRTIWALEDVSFEIKEGEAVGIIGSNGAGKSTLLKILSRVTTPSRGRAEIYGRVGSLLEVGTGFHAELTGRENVYLSGAILGMRKTEIEQKFDQIVDFSEVEKFIDTPVKHYSSGMYMRLAFAVAAHLDPDILLVDEVLSVGDFGFQRKCLAYAKTLLAKNATVIFVSHNLVTVTAMCSRVLYLADGKVRLDGTTEDVVRIYEQESRHKEATASPSRGNGYSPECPISITDLALLDQSGSPRRVFDYGERLRIRLHFEATQPVKNPSFVVALIRSDDVACCNYVSTIDGLCLPHISGVGTVEVLTPPLTLVADLYSLHVLVWDSELQRRYFVQQTGVSFQVRHHLFNTHFGIFHEPGQWTWLSNEATTSSTLLQAQREEQQ